ncbi:MAG: discoidin domain-containing protein [Anaerolineae bacterium]
MTLSLYGRKTPAATLVLFALALVAAACGTSAPAAEVQATQEVASDSAGVGVDVEIRPIEEVFSNGPPELIDITDAEATLIFVSDIPLACSVVYGETTDYGLLTLDQDMAGSAHTDHHPLISGLKPDTVYHYRLQGSAEDGTFYISQDMTFRTPPAEAQVQVNLASLEAGAQVIAVSSNYGGAANDQNWGANSALDGSRGSAWSSNGDGSEAFIEIQLARRAHLEAVEAWTRSMSNNTAQIFEFTLTTDGGEVLGPFTLPDASQPYRFEVDVVASTLRLDVVDSNGGNTGLVEFAAYGTPVSE